MKDKRFKIAHKEAKIGIVLVLFNFIWWFGFAYGLGSGSPEEYKYLFGFPEWFFYSCIAGFFLMVILVYLTVQFLFTDISFDSNDQSEGEA